MLCTKSSIQKNKAVKSIHSYFKPEAVGNPPSQEILQSEEQHQTV